jgi:peroxiredoxin
VLSISASNDGLATPAKIDDSRGLLPANTQFIVIEGGNHAQFGSYGAQPGDGTASIPAETQWAQTTQATTALLQRISQRKWIELVAAPDFDLTDTQGRTIRLSDYHGRLVVLILMRGFTWLYCRRYLAQLRQDYLLFEARGAEIIALGPDGPNAFRKYWLENDIPFIGCADIKSRVADQFHQEVNLFKLGRMPAILIVDREGQIRYSHYDDNGRFSP